MNKFLKSLWVLFALLVSVHSYTQTSYAQVGLPFPGPTAYVQATGGTTSLDCTGGTITTTGAYRVHTFNSSSNLVCTGSGTAEYLVVAGGGAGGGLNGGGGGGGGVLSGSSSLSATTYAVTVGAGGTPGGSTTIGGNGSSSTFNSLTAGGGGAGGTNGTVAAANGQATNGSGGGAPWNNASGFGTGNGSGFAGGIGEVPGAGGGGGGGAGGAGGNAGGSGTGGNGGAGTSSSISGSSVCYAGGGGGRQYNGGGTATCGGGNGGNGGTSVAGTANTGGGAGGDGNGSNAKAGGSGVVIVRYQSIRNPISLGTNSAAGLSTTIALSAGANIVAGDLVVVSIGQLTSSGTTVTGVSDGTNTYIKATGGTQGTLQAAELWYCLVCLAVTSPTITATFSATSASRVIGAVRVAGGITALDVAPAGVGTAASSAPTVSTGALASANAEIVFGFLYINSNPVVTEGSGFTQIYNENASVVTNHLAFQVRTSTSSVAYSPTTGTANDNVIMVAVFR